MTRAEEAALKALPPRWRKTKDGKGKIDSVLPVRKAYIRAYEQAEKDLVDDLKRILFISEEGWLERNIKSFIKELEEKK